MKVELWRHCIIVLTKESFKYLPSVNAKVHFNIETETTFFWIFTLKMRLDIYEGNCHLTVSLKYLLPAFSHFVQEVMNS